MKMSRLWLCLPPTLFAGIDYVVTMRGQPHDYWSGNYEAAFEANPVVRWCMTVHPWMFHGLTVLWLLAFCVFIVKTPRALAHFAMLAIGYSHAFCICTWLYQSGDGFFPTLAMCIACTIACVIAMELSAEPGHRQVENLPPR